MKDCPSNEFGVNRWGRNITCIECCAKSAVHREKYKCPHGRRKSECCDCGGSATCRHKRLKKTCWCRGVSGRCQHGNLEAICLTCNPSEEEVMRELLKNEIKCEHGLHKIHCRRCGAGVTCIHNKLRTQCTEC
mmetsp:Transcript_27885/g.36056  ORF Transcript_27885/g.36056 Transcript_27885/m.36056 type:complete len:133 (+) Transcript_27885:153-551(+)